MSDVGLTLKEKTTKAASRAAQLAKNYNVNRKRLEKERDTLKTLLAKTIVECTADGGSAINHKSLERIDRL